MNNYVKTIIRTDFQKKDGTFPICLRLTISRKIKIITLKKATTIDNWDEAEGLLRPNAPDSENTNLLLRTYLKRANDIVLKYDLKNILLTSEEFEREFFNDYNKECYYSFVAKHLENNKKTNEYSAQSMKSYSTELSKLKKFKKTLRFDEITVSFLESYEYHMRNKLGNKINTVHKSLKTIRTFINKAIKIDLITDNVFRKYKLKTEKSKREFLDQYELAEIESLLEKDIPNYYKNAVSIFLFCCYTGLRFQDVKLLSYSNISNDLMTIIMHKTKDIVSIPLTKKPKNIIALQEKNSEIVFRVPSNQTINRFLKDAIELTSIKKTISFHCSRHTFATHGITLGIPIEVISKLLGHTNIKTTLIYAKVVDVVKIREMQKWDM